MSTDSPPLSPIEVDYPDDDGLPMADNTLQYRWIVTIQGGLDGLFRDNPNVFVAGNLLWYPVEGDNTTRLAPDAMVIFGRPKDDYRGSYRQWQEGGVAPQVVFEVLSPSNTAPEMEAKRRFYERFGVEEYYQFDPEGIELRGWQRQGTSLVEIARMSGWVSPWLGIRFEMADDLTIFGPDGEPFETFREAIRLRQEDRRQREAADRQAEQAAHMAEQAARQAEEAARLAEEDRRKREESERQAAESARLAAESAQIAEHERRKREESERQAEEECRLRVEWEQKAERLAAQLRAMGLDPDA